MSSKRSSDGNSPSRDPPVTTERNEQLEEYFMTLAFLSSQRSKDPNTKVGACIVNDRNQILSTGYNGKPNGCPDDQMLWGREDPDPLKNKYMYVCHAELNAIVNKNSADVRGACVYVTLFPCNECAKLIIQSGIASVVYYSDKYKETESTKASKSMFKKVGVKHRQYTRTLEFNRTFEQCCPNMNIAATTESSSSECPSWDEYFMSFAFVSAHFSEEPQKTGACLVNKQHRIVGIGYNGLGFDTQEACPAEIKAILNKNCPDVRNCSLYVTHFPSNESAKLIVQSGITKVNYYFDPQPGDKYAEGARRIFDLTDIKYLKYTPSDSLTNKIMLYSPSIEK